MQFQTMKHFPDAIAKAIVGFYDAQNGRKREQDHEIQRERESTWDVSKLNRHFSHVQRNYVNYFLYVYGFVYFFIRLCSFIPS